MYETVFVYSCLFVFRNCSVDDSISKMRYPRNMLGYLSKTSIRNKRVLLRVDFNVPIRNGRVQETFRIRAVLPTIRRIVKYGNKVIILSHHSNPRQTLAPVARALGRLVGRTANFVSNPFSAAARLRLTKQNPGSVVLTENLRFFRGEQDASHSFARALARLGDVFVNDAFGVSHRRGASLTILPSFLPSFIGLNFEQELKVLDRLLHHSRRPLVAVFGGAKLETKLKLLRRFSRLAYRVLVGGAIANVLLRASGYAVKIPRQDQHLLAAAKLILRRGSRIVLPLDLVVSPRPGRAFICPVGASLSGLVIDLGPETIREFRRLIAGAGTVVWNGPLGITESGRGRSATLGLARVLANSRAWTIVGGGDTVAALEAEKMLGSFDYVSTGGAAMLAYLAGEKLPALEALRKS